MNSLGKEEKAETTQLCHGGAVVRPVPQPLLAASAGGSGGPQNRWSPSLLPAPRPRIGRFAGTSSLWLLSGWQRRLRDVK